MSALKALLAERIRDTLTAACITAIPAGDTSRVDGVYIRSAGGDVGRFRLVLVVKQFDPIKRENWNDATMGGRDNPLSLNIPGGIIGGQTFENTRGTVELAGNLTRSRESTDEADAVVQLVLGRAKDALRRMTIQGLIDEFGETLLIFRVVEGAEYDSGSERANTTRFFLRWMAVSITAAPQPV